MSENGLTEESLVALARHLVTMLHDQGARPTVDLSEPSTMELSCEGWALMVSLPPARPHFIGPLTPLAWRVLAATREAMGAVCEMPETTGAAR